MLKKLLQISTVILTFIAFSNVAAASNWVGYQPEIPKELK
ncbi:cyclic lactone autoinducer peptide [Caminicella sporogenes]|nr:cyclic lactone autoinducer peptide [Caminicella sporogenes]WIF94023.1 cyclic lactone autoinducer peptide [Caminicella sporogenes]